MPDDAAYDPRERGACLASRALAGWAWTDPSPRMPDRRSACTVAQSSHRVGTDVRVQATSTRGTTAQQAEASNTSTPRGFLTTAYVFPHPSHDLPEGAWAPSLPAARRSRACPSRWASRPACKLVAARLAPLRRDSARQTRRCASADHMRNALSGVSDTAAIRPLCIVPRFAPEGAPQRSASKRLRGTDPAQTRSLQRSKL